MQIRNISSTRPAFKGNVFINYNNVAKEIDECPLSTQESIIGNIKTLKERLQTQTPDYKTYLIDFDYKTFRESKYEPTLHVGTITVKDEQKKFAQSEFSLGQSGGSRPQDRTRLASGEEIWDNGFKDITSEALNGLTKINEKGNSKDLERLKKELVQRQCWDDVDFEEAKKIYDQIEDRARVNIDKVTTAASIYHITKAGCPDEIRESIIGNLNTLSWRLETETSKEKEYDLIIDNEIYEHGYCEKYISEGAKLIVSTNGSYEKRYLGTRCFDTSIPGYYYCTTDSEEIWQDVFKPVTDGILWDGHHYLPFDDDWKKREIVNKLS